MAVFGLPGQHVSVETFGGLTDVRPSQDDNIRLAPNTRYLPVESGLSFRTQIRRNEQRSRRLKTHAHGG